MNLTKIVCLIALTGAMSMQAQLFERVDPKLSGLAFRNDIIESDSFNVLVDFNLYNGGGVGVGDLNGDGLYDIVFSSTSNGITYYLNKGDWHFEDVTASHGLSIQGAGVNTGVLVADLNGDGHPDVYVCRRYDANRLFINNGNGTFVDRSEGSALSVRSFSTMAAVLDYDRDGDLDVYLVNSGEPRRNGYLNPGLSDQLFRNDGKGRFTDVTASSGIKDIGYGLSATIGDLNDDGWPDIYVTNDFEERDKIWINGTNGVFADSAVKAVANMSWASMGSDIADMNGDGLLDVLTVDMLPRDNYRRQTQLGGMSIYGPFFDSLQRVHNTLQLNRGNGRFSNVCYMAGTAATDWSWSVLAGDFDRDGRSDLFITNGTKRDLGDQDYSNNLFAGTGAIRPDAYQMMPQTKLPNFLFRNEGGLRFADVSSVNGLTEYEVSNGAAMVDLDNDGDLDIVVNNTDAVATLLRNRVEQSASDQTHWLGIVLRGPSENLAAIGARVNIYSGRTTLVREVAAVRGFQSTSDTRIVAGLGSAQVVDSVVVRWPNGTVSVHKDLKVDAYSTVTMPLDAASWRMPDKAPTLMNYVPSMTVPFFHREDSFDDFKRERLLPYRLSLEGPGIAVGDVNGDGLQDVVFTGAKYHPSQLFIQREPGRFAAWGWPVSDESDAEDVDAILVDVDNDKDLDLIIVTGGSAFDVDDPELADRLYKNNGKGSFKLELNALPGGNESGSCVVASDYDHDGDMDLFIGGRVKPGRFPEIARSVLLRNDAGRFVDVTDVVAKGLSSVGMTSRAVWADIDSDGDDDLVVVGEWMTPRVWRNDKGKFTDVSDDVGMKNHEGWWSSIHAADIDNDGDIDLIAGNVGLNCRFAPEEGKPLICYVDDFDDNGSLDPIVTYEVDGKRVPTRGRTTLTQHIPTLTRKYNTFAQFAGAGIDDILSKEFQDSARKLYARSFASCVFENDKGRFTARALPELAQISPIYAIVTRDLDFDGDLDLIVAGNSKSADGDNIGFDAGIGLVMINDGKGSFTPISPSESGFSVPSEARRMAILPLGDASDVLCVGVNGKQPMLFALPTAKVVRGRKR